MSAREIFRQAVNPDRDLPIRFLRSLFHHGRHNLRRDDRHNDLAKSEDGQALVEFAISLSVMASFFFTFIEICLVFYTYSMISESAREGTRYAALHGATCVTAAQVSCTASTSSINQYVSSISWPNAGGGTMTPVTSFPDGNENPGSRIEVTVNYAFPITLPFVPPNAI
ncbi:MAG: TadE family protein [Terracidiphilus sp.]